jgi:hypothetical protein
LIAVLAMAGALLASGCARKTAGEITGQFAPILHMRDQAVADAAAGKASLDPASLDQLGICYGDLRSKSDQYTQFVAGIVQSSSFDDGQNLSDARTLGLAVASYNDCLLKLQKVTASKNTTLSLSQLDADWVPAFGRAVEAYWARDGAMVELLSPDARASVVEQIKSAAVWPDFAAIGNGSPSPSPSP